MQERPHPHRIQWLGNSQGNSSGEEVKGQGEGILLSLGVKSYISEGIVICIPVGAGGNLEK